jgi:hypothetical protein
VAAQRREERIVIEALAVLRVEKLMDLAEQRKGL